MTLRDYLKETATSRAQFARRIDVSQETVRRYLTGERIPDKEKMVRIAMATACRVTANDFFGITAAIEQAA